MPSAFTASLLGAAAAAAGAGASTTPEQVHLAVAGRDGATGDATGFSFTWFTGDAVSAAVSVEYSVAGAAPTTVTGTSSQYLTDAGYHHTARAVGLPADTALTYRVGSDADGWSPYFNATTPPGRNTTRTVRLSVFGCVSAEGGSESE
jgi:hypothetical protein